ncbi:7317_t:CDS:1 [Funneliformis geosporum]|uniref:14086_t:CDS:1 n=1 Tax=Funneliformis geosporum TaxID=1117311 RepID=A0A9W4SIM7_9GLOM|nr:7317_t:CDS:1 [Funneliformis geosporum]CAI2171196.1 14086_t:CDS:1 [Funneliformis geosporum]
MPYTPPPGTTSTTEKIFNPWSFGKLTLLSSKPDMKASTTANSLPSNDTRQEQKSKPQTISRDTALQQVKEILSTSPQLSTSPRRKSAPDSYSRKPMLKVELPLQFSQEMPCILRKKSGEVVRPSLKKGSSKSEPATPTFPKYVHFNADLEQIKLFNEAQRPQAVSADASSEEEDSDDDDDFDFSISDDEDDVDTVEEPELMISLPNMPMITTMHSSRPVFVESIFLSRDKRSLQGRVMVQNLAFQKSVHIRYTFDFWSSVSEVSASYAEGVPIKDNKNSFDLFVFSIELIDNSRNPIDGKTMYFAVHYNVDSCDFWDNNNGSNYQINFKRMISPSSQPKSKNSTPVKSQGISPKWSMSSTPRHESLSPPTTKLSITNVSDPRKKLLGRYDIGVSLSAAQNAPRTSLTPTNPTRAFQASYYIPPAISYNTEKFNSFFPGNYIDGMPGTLDLPVSAPSSPWNDSKTNGFEPLKQNSNPIAIPSSKPAIGSTSYYDLVNQYCFYSGGAPYTSNSPFATSPLTSS